MSSNKLVVGLTGGIGSGKSTVADLFADKGVTIIDTDMLSRELTAPGMPAYDAIVERFGRHLLMENKHLNRKRLRKIIFDDPAAKLWLEKLLHPLIREEMKRLAELSTTPYCIVVIPLLFESEPNPLITRTLAVDATEELQLLRTQMRDMHKPEEVEAIMKAQVTREKRLASADDIIYNDKKIADLLPQVEKLHDFYLSLVNPA